MELVCDPGFRVKAPGVFQQGWRALPESGVHIGKGMNVR